MPSMLELIRQSAVPANLMRSAAKGALALPASEMLEVLVLLSKHPTFGEQARLTLASWDEASALELCRDPHAPFSVLSYYIHQGNRRPGLTRALIENTSVPDTALVALASTASREEAGMLLESARTSRMDAVLRTLEKNHHLGDAELAKLGRLLAELPSSSVAALVESPDDVLDLEVLLAYEREHAAEIAAEEHKLFELTLGSADEKDELAEQLAQIKARHAAPADGEDESRLSTLQKIARMSVGQRVQLAMKGTKDERFVLIRDGSKVVSLAVLESPKLTDAEMETFASMKNVQEAVLRAISTKRRFMKHYSVVRQLANNPRCPLDVGLSLLPHLMVRDLQLLMKNKNVSETIRKIALKMFKDKSEKRQG